MTKPKWSSLLFLCCLTILAYAAPKQKWVKLGARTVNHALDRDEIRVSAKEGLFQAVQLRVKRREVNFRDVKIHFSNGDVQDVEMRRDIPAGGETRDIQLAGSGPRNIEKVVFWYSTAPLRRRRAVVELWGLR